MEQELKTGFEFCPICGRSNEPGSNDTCVHFVGLVADGDLMWGQFDGAPGERFQASWLALQKVWLEVSAMPGARLKEMRALCRIVGIDPRWLEAEESALHALEGMGEFQKGPYLEPDGMASGSGYSLYHQNPRILASLFLRLERFASRLSRGPA